MKFLSSLNRCRPLLLLAALLSAAPLSAATVQTLTQEFDDLSRLSKQTFPDGSWQQYRYDLVGNRLSRSDNLGRNTGYEYDNQRRLVKITDSLSGVTLYAYDGRSNLVNVTDPRGLVTRYEYNGFDELLKQTSPDSGVSRYSYNGAGQTDSGTDAKQQTVKYRYDAAGRVDKLTYADQSTVSYGYGATAERSGKLQLISDSQGDQISISYDSFGRPLGEWRTIAGKQYITRENYDAAGRLKQRVYPSGRTVTYLFDAAGQINQVLTQPSATGATTVIAKDIAYRPFGGAKSWTFGNGEARTSQYDLNGRLTQLSLGDSTLTLSYDPAGRIATQKISGGWWQRLLQRLGLPAGQQHQYGYDNNDRLTSWKDGTAEQGYGYDANGNRTQLTINGKAFAQRIEATSNRLSASDGPQASVYQYDANGSRTSDSKQSYTYNARGRLVSAGGAQYVVNALGQRIIKTYQGQTTVYHYDRQGHLIAESDQLGNTKREYVYLDDTPIAVIDFGSTRYIHTDHLGTSRLITDATKRPIWAWQGEPFGNSAPNEDPEATGGAYAFNLRLPGQYFDRETGLYYNSHRDYDPAVGRYIQSDPIGLAGGVNTYAYVYGNPLSYSDPQGLFVVAEGAAFTGAVMTAGCMAAPGCTKFISDKVRGAINGASIAAEACGNAVDKFRNWLSSENNNGAKDPVIQIPGNKPPFTHTPGSTVQGGTGSRTYGSDGYPQTDRDLPHPDEAGVGSGDHAHDWDRPADGGPPTHNNRGPGRAPKPGDPPKPRGPNVPPGGGA